MGKTPIAITWGTRAIENYFAYLKNLASVSVMLKVVSALGAGEMGMTLTRDAKYSEGLLVPGRTAWRQILCHRATLARSNNGS